MIIILVIILLTSPLLKINSIEISGCDNSLKDTLNELLKTYQNKYTLPLIVNKSEIIETVLKNTAVKDVSVSINIFGKAYIEVTQATPLATAIIDNKYYIINDAGKVLECDQNPNLNLLPRCIDFDSLKLLQNFAAEFYKINDLLKNDITDIISIKKAYDPLLLEFIVSNGNLIHVRIDEMNTVLKKSNFDYVANKTNYQNHLFSFEKKHMYIIDLEK